MLEHRAGNRVLSEKEQEQGLPQEKHAVGGGARCVSCEIRNGLPRVLGKARGHYVSRQGGSRMLVLERRRGERLRINGTAEIVILEVHAEYVKITIESSPDNAAKLQR